MTLSLSQLQSTTRKRHRRVGRGHGSGRGTTAGRGTKGQRARTGGRKRLQRRAVTQFLRQLPKNRGFNSIHASAEVVNVGQLGNFKDGSVVTIARLRQAGLVVLGHRVKILGQGTIGKNVTVAAHSFSESARKAIEAAGGTAQVVTKKIRQPKKHQKS